MKVCMLAYTHYEEDNRVMRYAEALVARGDDVDVIALRHPNEQKQVNVQGVNVFKIQTRILNEKRKASYFFRVFSFLFRSAWFLAQRHRKLRYDVVHVHSVPDFLVFAAVYPKLTGAKVILDIHDILPEFYASKFGASKTSATFNSLLLVERVSARFAHHVIIANDLWRERITARSVPPEKCTTILNFPDKNIFCRKPKVRNDQRLIVLYPGSLGWHQGLDIAIRAFASVCDQLPTSEFHIYGAGGEKQKLIDLSKSLKLENRLFMHPSLPLREIAHVMAEADLGVVPKRSDTFGNEAFSTKILEFLTVGVPLIVSETAIDKYYFNDSVVRFFPSGDEARLAENMLELLKDPALRMQMVENGLAFVRRYDWDHNKHVYFDVIDSLMPPVHSGINRVRIETGAAAPKT